ncbi:glutathione peroxidase [Fundicoccus culcitae]|uniref:Glutathione peroxidase n=1 Tax=Fundicoccus culcitae TaxID=2969821 RepID=A0ABY5P292_9LACT|nr:glutathione peroxidase [Fundicoccus culcitae]UUX32831.1 glutathione peroxidase [Fundicoccus culcitae]
MSLPDFTLVKSNGSAYPFNNYNNYVILVVNTATQCGLADQFSGLETLYQTYKDQQFVVLGFPSNQFNQENVADSEMEATCQLNYGVTFPMHQQIDVNGKSEAALFTWLKTEKGGLLTSDIKWNFTKFLIDRDGKVIKRYSPKTEPKNITKDIEKLL